MPRVILLPLPNTNPLHDPTRQVTSENSEKFVDMFPYLQPLDSCFRRNDGKLASSVIPAEGGDPG